MYFCFKQYFFLFEFAQKIFFHQLNFFSFINVLNWWFRFKMDQLLVFFFCPIFSLGTIHLAYIWHHACYLFLTFSVMHHITHIKGMFCSRHNILPYFCIFLFALSKQPQKSRPSFLATLGLSAALHQSHFVHQMYNWIKEYRKMICVLLWFPTLFLQNPVQF